MVWILLRYEKNTTSQALINELPRIAKDEGLVLEIYLCPSNKLTFGYGTLITQSMQEYGLPVGTPITEQRCLEAFFNEMLQVNIDSQRSFRSDIWSGYPERAKGVFINMIYNMGLSRFNKFVNMKSAARNHDWQTVSVEMLDSLYARQVKSRATRLAARIRKL